MLVLEALLPLPEAFFLLGRLAMLGAHFQKLPITRRFANVLFWNKTSGKSSSICLSLQIPVDFDLTNRLITCVAAPGNDHAAARSHPVDHTWQAAVQATRSNRQSASCCDALTQLTNSEYGQELFVDKSTCKRRCTRLRSQWET